MRRVFVIGVAAALALASCGGDPPVGPMAGDLTLSYASPSTTDGALLLRITGGAVESVSPVGGHQVASAPLGPNATRVVITGALTAGDVLRVRVPDLSAAAGYAVEVEAAADRNTFALADPALYGATLRK